MFIFDKNVTSAQSNDSQYYLVCAYLKYARF